MKRFFIGFAWGLLIPFAVLAVVWGCLSAIVLMHFLSLPAAMVLFIAAATWRPDGDLRRIS